MAQIKLGPRCYIINRLRREFRQVGHVVRVKDDKVFVVKKPDYVYSRSKGQEECRERFRRAQELMMREFADPERVEYWTKKAKASSKYKTAKGCCKAHFYQMLKNQDILEQHRLAEEASGRVKAALARGESGDAERREYRQMMSEPAVGGSVSADEMREERLALGIDNRQKLYDQRRTQYRNTQRFVYVVQRRELDTLDADELLSAHRVFMRNGQFEMTMDAKLMAYYLSKGEIDKYIVKRRKKHAFRNMPFSYNPSPFRAKRPTGREGKILLKSDVVPSHDRVLMVNLEEVIMFNLSEIMQSTDVYINLAGRVVYLDDELVAKLRNPAFLRKLVGVPKKIIRLAGKR